MDGDSLGLGTQSKIIYPIGPSLSPLSPAKLAYALRLVDPDPRMLT